MISVDERFGLKVDRTAGPDACWRWKAATNRKGYGMFWVQSRMVLAHRYALESALGRTLQDGECALHRCDTPPCVNPAHLWAGTNAENAADREAKGRGRPGMVRGEDHGCARLTAQQVVEIRRLYAGGNRTQYGLAGDFDVSQRLVNKIVNRQLWRHL